MLEKSRKIAYANWSHGAMNTDWADKLMNVNSRSKDQKFLHRNLLSSEIA